MNDSQETEIAIDQVRKISELNHFSISVVGPASLVKDPPPLEGNKFFVVSDWRIEDNQLIFEFDLCEAKGIEVKFTVPVRRAYRLAVLRWMRQLELRAERALRCSRILSKIERLPIASQKMVRDYYGKTTQGRWRKIIRWELPVSDYVDVRVGGKIHQLHESEVEADVTEFIKAIFRERIPDYDTKPSAQIWARVAFTGERGYELFTLLRSRYPKARMWHDEILGKVYTRIGRKWYSSSRVCDRLPSAYTVPVTRATKAWRWPKYWSDK